jgi:hypothetical protein
MFYIYKGGETGFIFLFYFILFCTLANFRQGSVSFGEITVFRQSSLSLGKLTVFRHSLGG